MDEKKLDESIAMDGIKVTSEEDIAKVKEQIKEEVIKEATPTEQQNELFKKVVEEASMPVDMTNDDFKLGDSELDIRGLNKKNKDQMMFRIGVLAIVYAKQMLTSLIDNTRLLMVIADKMGVEDVVKATDDVIEKVAAKREELRAIIPDPNKKK